MMVISVMSLAGAKAFAQGCGGGASTDDGVKVFGFLQSQYEYFLTDPSQNSFSFERARIGVKGAIPYDFQYYVVLELSPYVAANPYLLDAFITYDRFKWAKVSIGSFKTPFGLEVNTACNDLNTIFRSTVSLQTVAPFRDMGMMFLGGDDSTKIKYQLGIMNGRGLGATDNNVKKDIVGRIIYKPFDFVQIGGSFRYGYPSLNNTTDERMTYGFEAKMDFKNILFTAEYINDQGNYNRDLGGGCSGNLIELGKKRSGYYATLGYMTPWQLQPLIRYDYFDSGNADLYKESTITFGLNYFFNDWTRLQINYLYRAEQPIELQNDMIAVQIQAKF